MVEKESQQAEMSAESMKSMLASRGISRADLERQKGESVKDETRRLERLKAEVDFKESELKKTRDLAEALIKSDNLIVKIDGKQTDDPAVPCPNCGASIEDARAAVYGLAGAILRQAGGSIQQLGIGGSMPVVVNSFKCPKCGQAHGVTGQLVM